MRLSLDLDATTAFVRSALGRPQFSFVSALQFNAGQSNPTYLLQGADGESYVLRRQPPGKLLPSAHDVVREYGVMTALANTSVPVPRMVALCTDNKVLGSKWYLMSYVAGRVIQQDTLPDFDDVSRRAIWLDATRVLAELHQVDLKSVGLESYGKPGGGYTQRQLRAWARQFRAVDGFVRGAVSKEEAAAISEASDEMERLTMILEAVVDEYAGTPVSEPTCLVHGDYRMGNLILSPDAPAVVAVLDWELSTLGHPLCDLAYFLGPWHSPAILGGFSSELPPGTPSERELLQLYAKARGIDIPSAEQWAFFLAHSWHRKAGIAHGVFARSLQGNSSSTLASTYGLAFCEMVKACRAHAAKLPKLAKL